MKLRSLALVAALAAAAAGSAAAAPVTTGVAIRGVTLGGVSTGHDKLVSPLQSCDFSNEDVDDKGKLEHASVQCKKDSTLSGTKPGLPTRFDAYCVVDVSKLGGRVIADPIKGNANHCLLSGIKPSEAQTKFTNAHWR